MHVACMGEKRNACRVLIGKAEREQLQDLDISGRALLNLNLKNQDKREWTGLMWFRIGRSGGAC